MKEREEFNKSLISKLILTRNIYKNIDQFRVLEFIIKKVLLARKIYELLVTLSQNNPQNAELIYNLTPNFQSHVLYLPDSVNMLRKILKNNEDLLYRLGHDQINFNIFGQQEKDAPSSILNIVINIVDTSKIEKGEPVLNFSRQNKLVTFDFFLKYHKSINSISNIYLSLKSSIFSKFKHLIIK